MSEENKNEEQQNAVTDNMPEGASDPGSDAPEDSAPDSGVQSDKAKIDNRARLREITAVLRKHHITRGVTPEKFRAILEELGPTYVKLGQIMSLHSDVLPQRYCDELMKLTSEVTPMPFSEVEEVINRSYREDWRNIFASIEHNTLGSASIAQVHKARLLDGRDVIVKVERKGIYDTMARDIGLLKRAVGEIGRKLVNNYIKQVMEDGFFHADPHPGNVKVMDGKIVWIDMGMMGRLTYRDRNLMATAVRAIAVGDIAVLESTILELGDVQGKIDSGKLYGELRDLMDRYGNASMGSIDAVEFFKDVMEIMKGNDIRLPHGMTMLVRGLTQMQGVLLNISPDINMAEIAAGRLREEMLQNFDWKKEAGKTGRRIYKAAGRTLDIPPLVKIALEEYLKGQARINMELDSTRKFSQLMRRLVRNLVMGLWVMALLISSSIICTTDMQPRLLGIPALGFFGYSLAFVICLYVFIRHLLTRNK